MTIRWRKNDCGYHLFACVRKWTVPVFSWSPIGLVHDRRVGCYGLADRGVEWQVYVTQLSFGGNGLDSQQTKENWDSEPQEEDLLYIDSRATRNGWAFFCFDFSFLPWGLFSAKVAN